MGETIETVGDTAGARFKSAFGFFQKASLDSGQAPTPTGQVAGPEAAKANVLDTLMGELTQVEDALVNATKPTKPALLAGKFKYAESVLTSTPKRVVSLKPGDTLKDKVGAIARKIQELRQQLATVKQTQVDLALAELTKDADAFEAEAGHLGSDYEKCAGEGEPAAKGRATLYGKASEKLVELTREHEDWHGQVAESAKFLGDSAGKFQEQLARLDKAEKAIDGIVGNCLPKLTTTPGGPDAKLPPAPPGKTVPEIELGKELEALKACGMSWVNAKQAYGTNPKEMQKLADYRKLRVDDWLKGKLPDWQMEVGPGKGWVSVGSSDPTSDYDISLNKHGEKKTGERRLDYQFVQDFNAWFRKEFGGEGGTVFDTNLYASAPPLIEEGSADAKAVNDVASLMKMRRYMSSGEFEAFRVETVEACGSDVDKQMEVEKNFALADMNFRTIVTDQLERARAMLVKRQEAFKKQPKPTGAQTEEQQSQAQDREWAMQVEAAGISDIDNWLRKGKDAKGIAAVGLVEEGEELLHAVEHILKDATLETTNEMYAEKIGEVRGQEAAIQVLKQLQAGLKGDGMDGPALIKLLEDSGAALGKIERGKGGDGKPLYFESNAINDAIAALKKTDGTLFESALARLQKSLESELGMRSSQLVSSSVISKFFANEAYQAGGPFEHIVTATQAAEADAQNRLAGPAKQTLGEEVFKRAKDLKTQLAWAEAGGEEAFKRLAEEEREKLLTAAGKAISKEVSEEKTKRQGKLDPEECLQSFNEQLGDFLKDLEHYGEDDPGKAIIQSSKYLERLLDATRLLSDKEMLKGVDKLQEELDLQSRIKNELIAARKGLLIMLPETEGGTVDQAEQRKAYACDFMKKLKVNSVAGLGKKYVKFGVSINAAARKALAAKRNAT